MFNYYPQYSGAMPDTLGQLRYQPQQQFQHQGNNGIMWVQGEAAAKSYPVAPNTTVMLLDSENSTFYLKTSDASGMPLPLRVFDYSERTQNASVMPSAALQGGLAVDLSNYVTYDYLNGLLDKMSQDNAPKKEKKQKGEIENG